MRRTELRRDELNVEDLVLSGLLLALGMLLHAIFPGVFAGMKPDFSLIMLFIILMLVPDKRIKLASGLATAVLTALTTTFPSGEIANLVDKIVTTLAVMGLLVVLPKPVRLFGVGILGTLVSGFVFLGTAAWVSGLPASFTSLVLAVVLPATAINTLGLVVLYPLAAKLYSLRAPKKVSAH